MRVIFRVVPLKSKTVAVDSSSIGNHESLDSPSQSWMNPIFAVWCEFQEKPRLIMTASSIWLLIQNRTEFILVILWNHEIFMHIWWDSVLLLLNHDRTTLSDDFCNWSTMLIIMVSIIEVRFMYQICTSPWRIPFGPFEDCHEFFLNHMKLILSHLMILLPTIRMIRPSYDSYTTHCWKVLSDHAFFARICNSWRLILIWIHLSTYISKKS